MQPLKDRRVKRVKGEVLTGLTDGQISWLLNNNIALSEEEFNNNNSTIDKSSVKHTVDQENSKDSKVDIKLPSKSGTIAEWKKTAESLGINTKGLNKRSELIAAVNKVI